MARQDFFLSFGSDAAQFGQQLSQDLAGARNELQSLASELAALDSAIEQRGGSTSMTSLVNGLQEANRLVGSLVSSLSGLGGEFREIAGAMRSATVDLKKAAGEVSRLSMGEVERAPRAQPAPRPSRSEASRASRPESGRELLLPKGVRSPRASRSGEGQQAAQQAAQQAEQSAQAYRETIEGLDEATRRAREEVQQAQRSQPRTPTLDLERVEEPLRRYATTKGGRAYSEEGLRGAIRGDRSKVARLEASASTGEDDEARRSLEQAQEALNARLEIARQLGVDIDESIRQTTERARQVSDAAQRPAEPTATPTPRAEAPETADPQAEEALQRAGEVTYDLIEQANDRNRILAQLDGEIVGQIELVSSDEGVVEGRDFHANYEEVARGIIEQAQSFAEMEESILQVRRVADEGLQAVLEDLGGTRLPTGVRTTDDVSADFSFDVSGVLADLGDTSERVDEGVTQHEEVLREQAQAIQEAMQSAMEEGSEQLDAISQARQAFQAGEHVDWSSLRSLAKEEGVGGRGTRAEIEQRLQEFYGTQAETPGEEFSAQDLSTWRSRLEPREGAEVEAAIRESGEEAARKVESVGDAVQQAIHRVREASERLSSDLDFERASEEDQRLLEMNRRAGGRGAYNIRGEGMPRETLIEELGQLTGQIDREGLAQALTQTPGLSTLLGSTSSAVQITEKAQRPELGALEESQIPGVEAALERQAERAPRNLGLFQERLRESMQAADALLTAMPEAGVETLESTLQQDPRVTEDAARAIMRAIELLDRIAQLDVGEDVSPARVERAHGADRRVGELEEGRRRAMEARQERISEEAQRQATSEFLYGRQQIPGEAAGAESSRFQRLYREVQDESGRRQITPTVEMRTPRQSDELQRLYEQEQRLVAAQQEVSGLPDPSQLERMASEATTASERFDVERISEARQQADALVAEELRAFEEQYTRVIESVQPRREMSPEAEENIAAQRAAMERERAIEARQERQAPLRRPEGRPLEPGQLAEALHEDPGFQSFARVFDEQDEPRVDDLSRPIEEAYQNLREAEEKARRLKEMIPDYDASSELERERQEQIGKADTQVRQRQAELDQLKERHADLGLYTRPDPAEGLERDEERPRLKRAAAIDEVIREQFPDLDPRQFYDPAASPDEIIRRFDEVVSRIAGEQVERQPEEARPPERDPEPGDVDFQPTEEQLASFARTLERAEEILAGTFMQDKPEQVRAMHEGAVRKDLLTMAGRQAEAEDPQRRREVPIDRPLVEQARAISSGGPHQETAQLRGMISEALATPRGEESFGQCCERIVAALNRIQQTLSSGVRVQGESRRSESGQQGRPTKQDLYRQAQELDVPGRGSMNRDELVEAVQAAQAARQAEEELTQARAESVEESARRQAELAGLPDSAQQIRNEPDSEWDRLEHAARFGDELRRGGFRADRARDYTTSQFGLSDEEAQQVRARMDSIRAAQEQHNREQQAESQTRQASIDAENELLGQQLELYNRFSAETQAAIDRARELNQLTGGERQARMGEISQAQTEAIQAMEAEFRQREIGGRVVGTQSQRNVEMRKVLGASGPDFDRAAAEARSSEFIGALDQSVQREAPQFQQTMSNALFGQSGFMGRMMRSTGTFIVRNFASGFVFGMTRHFRTLIREALQTEAQFIRVSDALEATGRSAAGVRTELQSISTDLGVPLEEVYSIASNITGAFEEVADVEFGTRIVAQLEMISQGALTAEAGFDALQTIAAAFELEGVRELERIQDTAVAIQNVMAVGVNDVIEGIGGMAGQAAEMNFELEQAAVLVSAVAKGTNQGGKAAAEQFGRILSTFETQRGRNVLLDAGIGDRGMFAQNEIGAVVFELIENYDDLTEAQQRNIKTTFGSRREARALNALLNRREQILTTLTEAENAHGLGQERVNQIMREMANQIRVLGTNFTNFGAVLVRSGLLNFFGLMLRGINTVLGGLNSFLSMMNDLADRNPILSFARDAGMVLIGLTATMKGLSVASDMVAASLARQAAAAGTLQSAAAAPLIGGKIARAAQRGGMPLTQTQTGIQTATNAAAQRAAYGASAGAGAGFVPGAVAGAAMGRGGRLGRMFGRGRAPGVQHHGPQVPGISQSMAGRDQHLNALLTAMVARESMSIMQRIRTSAPRMAGSLGRGIENLGGRLGQWGERTRGRGGLMGRFGQMASRVGVGRAAAGGAAAGGMTKLGSTIATLGPKAWLAAGAIAAVAGSFALIRQAAERERQRAESGYGLIQGDLSEELREEAEERQREEALGPLSRFTARGREAQQEEAERRAEELADMLPGERAIAESTEEASGFLSRVGSSLLGLGGAFTGFMSDMGSLATRPITAGMEALSTVVPEEYIEVRDEMADRISGRIGSMAEGLENAILDDILSRDSDSTAGRFMRRMADAHMPGRLSERLYDTERDRLRDDIEVELDGRAQSLAAFMEDVESLYTLDDDDMPVVNEGAFEATDQEGRLEEVARQKEAAEEAFLGQFDDLQRAYLDGAIDEREYEARAAALRDARDEVVGAIESAERAILGLQDIDRLMAEELDSLLETIGQIESIGPALIGLDDIEGALEIMLADLVPDASSWAGYLDALTSGSLTEIEFAEEVQQLRVDALNEAERHLEEARETGLDEEEIEQAEATVARLAGEVAQGQQQIWDNTVSTAHDMAELAGQIAGGSVRIAEEALEEAEAALMEQIALVPADSPEYYRLLEQLDDLSRVRVEMELEPQRRDAEMRGARTEDPLEQARIDSDMAQREYQALVGAANAREMRGERRRAFLHDAEIAVIEAERNEASALEDRLESELQFEVLQTEDPRIQAMLELEAAIAARDRYQGDDPDRIRELDGRIIEARRQEAQAIDQIAQAELDLALSETEDPREQAMLELEAALESRDRYEGDDPAEIARRQVEVNNARRQEAQAIDQVAQAELDLALSATEDPREQALLRLQEAIESRDRYRGDDPTEIASRQAEVNNAEREARDAERAERDAIAETEIALARDPEVRLLAQIALSRRRLAEASERGRAEQERERQNLIQLEQELEDERNRIVMAQYQTRISATRNPVRQAEIQLQMAREQLRQAEGRLEVEQAIQAVNAATHQLEDATNQVILARYQTRLSATEDPLQQARIQLQMANEQLRQAQGQADREAALQAINQARLSERDALEAIAQSQASIAQAIAQANDDQVELARLQTQELQRQLAEARRRGQGQASINELRAQIIAAEAAQRDAVLQDKLDTINFNREMGHITANEAISALQRILEEMDLTERQRRDLKLQIKRLQDDLRDQLTGSGFNIPTEIDLPTAYQVRRSLGMGTSNMVSQAHSTTNVMDSNNTYSYQIHNTFNQTVASDVEIEVVADAVARKVAEEMSRGRKSTQSTPHLVGIG